MKERRLSFEPVQLRAVENGKREFVGHAAVFDTWADIGGMFREQVRRGTFAESILGADVPFVFNHDDATVMARTSAGNLKLSEDRKGLFVRADLDERDNDVRQLAIKIENGNVSGMSFAFRATEDAWDDEPEGGGIPERTLIRANLYDVSPVTSPAYAGTDAAIRAEARSVLESHTLSPENVLMRLAVARARKPLLRIA